MNTTETHAIQGAATDPMARVSFGGIITERIGAIATIVLAILGLAGILAGDLAGIGTIVIGAVMLMDGGLARQARRRLAAHATYGSAVEDMGGGISAEFLGGFAGIVLGILAMFQSMSHTLLAVALLVYGAVLLLSGGPASPLAALLQFRGQPAMQNTQGMAFATQSSGHIFVGLAALVLGILAVVGLVPLTLVLVGLLGLGANALFSCPAVAETRQQW